MKGISALQEELGALLMGWPQVDTRRMFGCQAFLVGGKLFAFLTEGGVVLKLPVSRREELLDRLRARPFMHRGVPFGAWVELPLAAPADLDQARVAVGKSYAYVQARARSSPGRPSPGLRPRRPGGEGRPPLG